MQIKIICFLLLPISINFESKIDMHYTKGEKSIAQLILHLILKSLGYQLELMVS